MNLYKQIILHEVFPAIGCTEPISCAYAASLAAFHFGKPMKRLLLRVDPGTYKNGAAATIPHTHGAKGNLIAAILGAILKKPEDKLEILNSVTPEVLEEAIRFNHPETAELECLENTKDFRIEVTLQDDNHYALCVLSKSHTNVEKIEVDGKIVLAGNDQIPEKDTLTYREIIKKSSLKDLLLLAEDLDQDDFDYLHQGIEMNLRLSQRGKTIHLFAYEFQLMLQKGYIVKDLFFYYQGKRGGGSRRTNGRCCITYHDFGRLRQSRHCDHPDTLYRRDGIEY